MTSVFDIVFQSGEFINPEKSWLTDLFVTTIGAAIGAGATITALYFTFKHDKKKEEKRRIQFQIEKLRYFQILIKNIVKVLTIQIDCLKTFSETINANPLEIPLLNQNPQNDIVRVLTKINQEDYFHAYIGQLNDSPESIEEFRKLFALIDYFDASINNITDSLKNTVQFDHERKIKLKKIVEDTMDEAAYFLANPTNAEHVMLLEFFNETLENVYKNQTNSSDIKYFHENLVKPLKFGLIKSGVTSPEILALLKQLKNATHLYNEIQTQNIYVAADFQAQYDNLKTQLIEFTAVTTRLIEYKHE